MKLQDLTDRLLSLTFTWKTVGATEKSSGTMTGQKTDSACSLDVGLEGLGADTGSGGLERLREHPGSADELRERGRNERWGGLGAEATGPWTSGLRGLMERKELRVLPSSRWVTEEIK